MHVADSPCIFAEAEALFELALHHLNDLVDLRFEVEQVRQAKIVCDWAPVTMTLLFVQTAELDRDVFLPVWRYGVCRTIALALQFSF